MISLVQMEYIIAVDTYKHFAKAAEKCLVTQPTLSMQIKKMEESLNVVVFDRSHQPVKTTTIGKLIVEQARKIVRESKQIEEIVVNFHKQIKGSLRVGVIPTISPYLVPLFVGDLVRNNPDFKVSFSEKLTQQIVLDIKNNLLDVGIVATPLEEELTEDPLYYEELFLYTHPKNPLVNRKIIHPDKLDMEQMWMLSEGNCFRDHVINLCDLKTDEENTNLTFESSSLETLKKMVDLEGGFMILPELAVLDLSSKHLNQIKSFVQPKPLREVSLIYPKNMADTSLIQLLKTYILKNIPEEMKNKKRGGLVEWK